MRLAVPYKDQTLEHDVNKLFDCVPTCIASAVEFLIHTPTTGAELKALVYGTNYVGGTAAAAYINECARRGVRLWSIGGDGPALVKAIRVQLRRGSPVLVTVPDQYSSDPNMTHVLLMFGMDEPPGTLVALDTFGQGGHDITRTDADWAKLFLFNEVWAFERIAPMNVPTGWHDDGTMLLAPNNIPIVKGFRDWVLAHNWDPTNLPLEPERGLTSIELSNAALGPGSRQRFRLTTLEWTQAKGVFVGWCGQELIFLENALYQSEQRLQTLSTQLHAQLQDIEHLLTQLLSSPTH